MKKIALLVFMFFCILCNMNGQIYVYYTSDSQVEYPYEFVLYSNDRIQTAVRDQDMSDTEILEDFRSKFDKSDILYSSRDRTFFYYSPEYSTSEKRIFTHTYNGQLFFDSFSKDMKKHESWGSKRLKKKVYSLLRIINCDVSVITNGEMTSPAIPHYETNYNGGGVINNSSRQQYTPSTRNKSKRHICNLCRGKKRIVKDTYPSLYGTKDYQVKCNECGGYFMRSTGHTHITCPQCHGKGYFTTD